jgi:hypothetical protein
MFPLFPILRGAWRGRPNLFFLPSRGPEAKDGAKDAYYSLRQPLELLSAKPGMMTLTSSRIAVVRPTPVRRDGLSAHSGRRLSAAQPISRSPRAGQVSDTVSQIVAANGGKNGASAASARRACPPRGGSSWPSAMYYALKHAPPLALSPG